MKFMRFVLFMILLLNLASCMAEAQLVEEGTVEGTVRFPDGKPAPDFSIFVLGTSKTSTPKSRALADDHGSFQIQHLLFGTYIASAYLEGEGSHYPPQDGDFYDTHVTRFALSAEHPSIHLIVALDTPRLILSGVVSEAITDKPILATIKMWQTIDPKYKWIRFGSFPTGSYHCWIPPGKTILLRASAAGYRDYETTIPAITNGVDPVVNIVMQPIAKPDPTR